MNVCEFLSVWGVYLDRRVGIVRLGDRVEIVFYEGQYFTCMVNLRPNNHIRHQHQRNR